MFIINILCLLGATIVIVKADKMIAQGEWSIINIDLCPEPEKYILQYEISKKKLTRTMDAFDGTFDLEITLDESYGMHAEMCQFVDGGCKDFNEFKEDSFVRFLKKYADKNVKDLLTAAGADDTDFPLKPGNYNLENFVFDKCELPKDGVVGTFGVTGYLLNRTEPIACCYLIVKFEEYDEDEENECE